MRVLVTGASGFLGRHLCAALTARGDDVTGLVHHDAAHPGPLEAWRYLAVDLTSRRTALNLIDRIDAVYDLAASAGGVAHQYADYWATYATNTRLNLNVLQACAENGVGRYFFASSACVYGRGAAAWSETDTEGLPATAYGLQKLAQERACAFAAHATGLPVRIARLGNVYGPGMAWEGPRATVVGDLCRKVAEAQASGADTITLWGDGQQRRAFVYVADAVRGMLAVMDGLHPYPVNLGGAAATVQDVARGIAAAADWRGTLAYDPTALEGPRNCLLDSTQAWRHYDWQATTGLATGLAATYADITARRAAAGVVR